MAFIGFLIMYSQLDEPIFFAYQGLILGAVFFGLGVVVMAIAALVDRGEKRSIYFCGHCKFASSTEAELYNHSVKEHNDELGYDRKYVERKVDEEEVEQKPKPKRSLRKSPTLKGTMIGIIAVSIVYGAILGVSFQSFHMSNDAMAPTINKGDLMRYDNTPFHEIQANDVIFYSDNDKVWVHRVIRVDSSSLPTILLVSSEDSFAIHRVSEGQYIGKLTSVIEGAGTYTWLVRPPMNIIILIATFVIPIAVMRIRERRRLKAKNS